MLNPSVLFAPLRASFALTNAMIESTVAFQQGLLNAGMNMGETFDRDDETRLREVFHATADANLRRWERTAEVIQDLPDVYLAPVRMPGRVLTDWFDTLRRS